MKLLTVGGNAKINKSDAGGEYLTAILHLAPWTLSGTNVCPSASVGCRTACLNTSGRGRFDSVQRARIRKTQWWARDKMCFLAQLQKDIDALKRKCARLGVKPAIRLNGTSDIPWETVSNIIQSNPDIQFYDYTKIDRLAGL